MTPSKFRSEIKLESPSPSGDARARTSREYDRYEMTWRQHFDCIINCALMHICAVTRRETAKEMFINRYLDLILACLLCKHLTWDLGGCIHPEHKRVYSQGNGLDEIITPWRLDEYKTKKRRRDWDRQLHTHTYTWNRLYSFTQAWPFLSLYSGGKERALQECHAGKQRWLTGVMSRWTREIESWSWQFCCKFTAVVLLKCYIYILIHLSVCIHTHTSIY